MRKKTVLAPISTGLVLLSLLTIIAPTADALTTKARSYYENKQTVGGTQVENHAKYFEIWRNGNLVDNFPSSLVDSYADTENYERVAYSVHEPAKAGRSFSPSVRNTFSWRPTDTIQKKGPLENYVENQGENIRIESYPTYVEVLRDENFANDNYQYVIENIPDDWIVSENSTFVEFEPPGKPVWVWDMNVIQENVLGRFRKSGPASVYKIQFTVKPNNVTRAVEGAYENLDASIFNSDYYYRGREADLTDISALENELEEIPVHASVGSFENAVTRPITPPTGGGRNWIDLGGSNKITLTVSLNKKSAGYACASGKLGSHSISWTVSSSTDWWDSSSPDENDVRTTIDNTGNLVLSGENAALWMPLDNFSSGWKSTDNTVYDLTSLNNNGTAYDNGDNLNIVSGKWDNALEFDGVDDYALVPDSPELSALNEFTVSGWIYLHTLPTTRNINATLLAKYCWNTRDAREFRLFVDKGANQVALDVYDEVNDTESKLTGNTELTTNTWYHVVGVYDGGNELGRIYINGELDVEDTSFYQTVRDTVQPVEMGLYDYEAGGYDGLNGLIDDVRIYDRALTENEIKRIYNRTKPESFDPPENSIKVGTWTSQVWDSGDTSIIENIDYSATVGSGENVWWNIEATDTSENTGWFKDPNQDNLIAQSELPNSIQGENFQLNLKLETDNSTSSPNVQDWTLSVDPVPEVLDATVDNTLIDRKIDYSGSGADDNAEITATIRDNDGLADFYRGDNAPQFSVKDSTGAEVAHRPVAWDNLVGYWDFQDNSSLDTWDKSGENNAGTMYNFSDNTHVENEKIVEPTLDSWYNLETHNLYENSELVTDNTDDEANPFVRGTDYLMDYENGRIKPLSSGTMSSTENYLIDYDYWSGYASVKRGRALEFDGVDDYVELGKTLSDLGIDNSYTFSAWIKCPATSGDHQIMSLRYQFHGVRIAAQFSRIYARVSYDGTASSLSVNLPSRDNFYLVTLTATSGEGARLYLDSSLKDSITFSGNLDQLGEVLAIGRQGIRDVEYFNGTIDEPRIYDRALTESEIREIYRSGLRYHEVDENTVEVSTTYNPSDAMADSQLGGFDAKMRVVDDAGAADNLTSSGLFTVADWSTSVSYTPEYDSIYKGENITVSGTANPIGISDNADNIWIDDEYTGTFYADPSANDWSKTYKVSAPVGSTVQENVRIRYQGSVLDGRVASSYAVKNNVRVENIRTYDVSGNPQSTFGLGENVVVKFESLDNRGQFGIDTSNLTLTDPTGLNRIDHQQTLSYKDVFNNEDNWDDLTANHWVAGDYFGSPDTEYACGPNGGSSSYEDLTLIKESTLENRENIAITAQTCIDYETEDRVGLVFRYQDNQNYCEAFWTDYYSSAGIAVHEAGDVYTKSVSFFPDNGQWYKMKVVANGKEATLYINGNKMVTHYDLPGFGKGRTGLRADAGYTYFDNLTINHAKGEVDASLDNGYRYRYEYTIPENGDLVGTWDIVPEAKATNGATDNSTSTFSVAENAPVIKSTDFYDSSLNPVSEYTAGENMRIRSDVIDSKGRDNLKSVRAIIINPEGTQKENVAMASVDTINNGYTYEENYTIPREDASEGIWNVRIYAEDVDGYSLIENNYIHDRTTDPEIGPVSTRNQDLENLKVLPLEDNLKVRADITDPNGRENISDVNISIFNQDGTKVVDSASMAAVENIDNGRTYEYEYSIPRSKDNFGSWRVEVFSTDGPFTSALSRNFKIEWRYLGYEWRKPIHLNEQLGVSRTNEESGFEFTIPTSKWDQDNGIRITAGGGEEVPFRVWKGWTSGSERHILVNFLENIGADENSTYYVYYDNSTTGASYPNYENRMSRTFENVAFAKWFYTHETGQITYPKSVDVGNVNGGSKEIAVFGQTKAGTETDRAFVRLYNLDFNSPSDASLTQVDNERWYTDNNTFAYGGKIFDVNGDGDNEIVVGGVAQDNDSSDNNRGQLSVWDYDSGSFSLLDNATWETGKTSVYGLAVSDMDGDGTVEIVTGGQTDSGDNGELRIWDFSSGTLSLQTSGKFSIASGHSDRWYSAEICNLGFNSENNIVVAGVGENENDVLFGIAGIYSYDGTTLTRNDTLEWQKGGEVTEFFGLDCGDVDQDGDTELTISGNWYDGTRDRAFFRVYNTNGGAFNLENWRDWYLKGRGSALTNIIKDTDYDNIKELTTVGFANDGSLDRGQYRQFLWDNSDNSAVEEHGSYWKPDYSVRAGDFSDAAVVSEFNDYDIKYLVDVGRWQLTPPTAAYVRVQAVDGVIETVGAEQELNRPPKILSVSSDVSLIDRDVDYAGSGAVDAANITVKAKNCRSRYLLKPLTLWIRDSKDALTVDGVSVSENTAIDENTLEFTYHFDPSNKLPNDNMGKFDVKIKSLDQFDNENISGFTELGHGLFAVDDRETTINYSPGQMLYSGDKVTIGGKVSGFYEPVSLDNVVLKDSVDGTFRPDILDSDSWEVSYSVSQGRHEVTVGVLDKGSRLDGSKTLRFDVESGKSQPSFNPTKQNLNVNLQVGLYQGREPTKGGRIEFKPASKFRPGDRVTVVAYLSVNGVKVSHADITGSWNGSSFPMGDKKANRFVGTFTIPKGVKSGSYLVSVDASARGLQSTASKTITVEKAKGISPIGVLKEYWWLVAIIVIILLLIALS